MIVLRPILGQENSLCTELGQEGAELDASLSALLLSPIFSRLHTLEGFNPLFVCLQLAQAEVRLAFKESLWWSCIL